MTLTSIKKPVISSRNESRKAPINYTVYSGLIIKSFNLYSSIPGAICIGVMIVIVLGLWALYIIDLIKFEEIPLNIFNLIEDAKSTDNSTKVSRRNVQPNSE